MWLARPAPKVVLIDEFVTTVVLGGVLNVTDRTTMETELTWTASGKTLRMAAWAGTAIWSAAMAG